MPSKYTFALVALLAATSVSALPTRGSWVDLVERGPDTPVTTPAAAAGAPAVVSPAAVLAQTPVSGGSSPAPVAGGTVAHHNKHPHQHPHRRTSQHNTEGSSTHGLGHGHGHPNHHPSHDANGKVSADGTTTPHKRRRHRHPSAGSAVTPPVNSATVPLTPPTVGGTTGAVTPPTTGPTLTRREFYEALYPRDPTHPHGHHHPHPHHHHHHHPHPQMDQQATAPQPDPAPAPAPSLQGREYLESRGFLEAIGLKARVSSLTVKQTDQISKAKTICGGLASKKDQHTCHKTVDKITQLTKERNYDVEQFVKISNHHDVFSSESSSSKSSTSSSSLSSHF